MEETNKLTLDDTVDFFKSSQNFLGKLRKDHHTAERTIESKLPILLVVAGDLHLGAMHTDYDAFRELVRFVKETPNAYLILNGDLIDNFDSLSGKLMKAGIEGQLVSPATQREVWEALMAELGHRILVTAIGNHEEFSSADFFLHIARKHGIPVGLNRITLDLRINNGWKLKVAVIHRGKGNSYLNPNHANRREQFTHYPDADVVIVGHTHTPAIQTLSYPKDGKLKEVIFLQTGSFKSGDAYTYKYFNPYVSSKFAVHGLILMPDSKTIQPVFGLEKTGKIFNRLWGERYDWQEWQIASGLSMRLPNGQVVANSFRPERI